MRLLREGVVSEIHLNDLDSRIATFWNAVLREPNRFAEDIMSVPVTITEWRRQQEVYSIADQGKPFELGFAVFYLNRCNRSGIISGAAPIGGYAQTGEWKIDARFYRESLAERILAIGKLREQIHVTNMDALLFLTKCLPPEHNQQTVFAYLDPPYYSNGNRLYMDFYDDQDHRELARYIQGRDDFMWLMSYDDTDFIRSLYATCEISRLSLEYSLQGRRKVEELLISPSKILLPEPILPSGGGEAISAGVRRTR